MTAPTKVHNPGWANVQRSESMLRAKFAHDHRQRRLWLADYSHLVDCGLTLEQIAPKMNYGSSEGLLRRLRSLEKLGYDIPWPQFPSLEYDFERMQWWLGRQKKSSEKLCRMRSGLSGI